MRRRDVVTALVAVLFLASCGDDGDDPAPVASATTTTSSAPAPTTTTVAPTTSTTAAAARATTTTSPRSPAEEIVDRGTSAAGAWQLVARRDGGLLCAELRGVPGAGGRVCNSASEQDANGNETLRYSTAGDGAFIVGVGVPAAARVRAELRDGATAERATVAASFTAEARFVALPLPAGAVIRSLSALDAGGRALTRIVVNP